MIYWHLNNIYLYRHKILMVLSRRWRWESDYRKKLLFLKDYMLFTRLHSRVICGRYHCVTDMTANNACCKMLTDDALLKSIKDKLFNKQKIPQGLRFRIRRRPCFSNYFWNYFFFASENQIGKWQLQAHKLQNIFYL